jgi:hypothetical protein
MPDILKMTHLCTELLSHGIWTCGNMGCRPQGYRGKIRPSTNLDLGPLIPNEGQV